MEQTNYAEGLHSLHISTGRLIAILWLMVSALP
jgi:hypothetical protein